jgi:gliding motility-associated-like protein
MKQIVFHILCVCCLFITNTKTLVAQNLFHQDIFYGGVTAGGFSTGQGAGSGTFTLYIEPGSTIRKAYLFSYRIGYPPSVPITLNGTPYIFDTLNCIMSVAHPNPFANPIKLYFIDITSDLNNSITTTFNVTIPDQFGLPLNWSWLTAYVYIEYENPSLSKVASTVWINNKDFYFLQSTFPYNMNGMNPIDVNFPVGVSLFTDRLDYSNKIKVIFDGNFLGDIAFSDNVNWHWSYAGVKGHFFYQNNSLNGLDDDTENNTMLNSDGLADVASYLSNGATSYDLLLKNEFIPPHPGADFNSKGFNLLFINAYTTSCDTFSTSIISDTVICKGDSIQLFALGGINYSWFPQNGLNNSGISNPIVSPNSTTLYTVRIENTLGCSRTEKVLVKVNQLPIITNLNITTSVCGNDDGQITVNASGSSALQYSNNSVFQSSNSFSNLATGNYTITVLDAKGCSKDTTIVVPELNLVNTIFTANPETGTEPLFVDLNNQSVNANNFVWLIDTNPLSNSFNTSYTFDTSGLYTVSLIAYNNLPQCADTFSLQIIVYDSLIIQIPNVFTPNNDGINDVFAISVDGAKEIKLIISNRWGNVVKEYENNTLTSPISINAWDGKFHEEDVSDGVYYYTIKVIDTEDKTHSYQGFIHVFN